MKGLARVQFDFSPGALALLDELKDRMGSASRAEVVRRSLHLMDLALAGKWLILRGSDGIEREVKIV